MEVAHSLRFLRSTMLFSLTSEFAKKLKTELWLCHVNMKLSMEDLYNMTVADRIREKRLEMELSQDELAKRLGYRDKTSISKIEKSF